MNKEKVSITKKDKLIVYFEGHTFRIQYDPRTNENLEMEKLL